MENVVHLFLKIFTISATRYFVIAGIAFLLCYKILSNWLTKAKIQSRTAANADFYREILHSVQTTAILAVIACLVLNTPLRNYTWVYSNLADYPTWWIIVSLVLCLIIHDTYFYWMHRLLHHPKLFRHTHLLHHKSTNPSPWTSYSFHFFEAWTEGGVLLVIVFVLPVHTLTIALFTFTGFIINVYGHLGYEIVPKRFRKSPLFGLFNTSVHHNLHHKKFNGNYGLYFRVWDRLMRTEHTDYVKEFDRVQQNRFGTQISDTNEPLATYQAVK
ncbi:sterol desaturase/sphingolipid hydroxylase (fatty acid hydroxylase superfamily) [Mucilaginibacter gracilis]|uniref:Sterol desaturase/sphingolipid hydroxylase (Fatty acid hydroxylase superfamily) n=1 Tax=Mucilaginibacter gracilis TaxID=423350 RepID=A0A495J779_9SPHI|nr:sterol desaturase family protein [Mucilaginibacter gracilis]RKR84452.1 sterol desaturase/sphingolipid hydroxylase (fatty acid hydroxylase superfamily) [Mucilaginibacter gracilis]